MMYLLILLGLSLCLNLYIYRKHHSQRRQLQEVHQELQHIIEKDKNENLLLFTEEPHIQSLLIQINRLLEFNRSTVANYSRIERSMRRMLSNISHDLKTPLTVVLGYTEILMNDDNLSKEKKDELLHTVNIKTVEVLELINRFFELAKLEAGDRVIDITKVNVSEICRNIILDYYEVLTSQGFDVSISIPDASYYAWGNKVEIERVLHNLLKNAIQHGGDGKMVGLEITADQQYVYIEVSDKGKGISEIHKDHVFERLYTMDDSRNKLSQGSGLGLTITKRLVEEMRGQISFESSPFQKTAFLVKLEKYPG